MTRDYQEYIDIMRYSLVPLILPDAEVVLPRQESLPQGLEPMIGEIVRYFKKGMAQVIGYEVDQPNRKVMKGLISEEIPPDDQNQES